jgi:GNAT superfamily N-acetyltransferase
MAMSNFERMIRLADEVFAVKNDPDQLDVDEYVLERLKKIHPATVSEYADPNGPVAWVLLIPTTEGLMKDFLDKKITEKELFEKTPIGDRYEAIYLCSAMVLQEYRRKGITKQLTQKAIEEISKDHTLKALFVWTFSEEGNQGAETIARLTKLPLFKR